MPRKVGHAIHDILEAIDRIEQITRGKMLSDFESSWQLRWLVHRAIEIISEQAARFQMNSRATRPEIPWSKVRGIGSVLRHEYSGLSNRIIWNVVVDELPRLKVAIEAIQGSHKRIAHPPRCFSIS